MLPFSHVTIDVIRVCLCEDMAGRQALMRRLPKSINLIPLYNDMCWVDVDDCMPPYLLVDEVSQEGDGRQAHRLVVALVRALELRGEGELAFGGEIQTWVAIDYPHAEGMSMR